METGVRWRACVRACSLCLRRSSVHERRGSISAKDARDEALTLRQSVAMPPSEDDDDDGGGEGRVLDAITVTQPPPPIIVVQVSSTYSPAPVTMSHLSIVGWLRLCTIRPPPPRVSSSQP